MILFDSTLYDGGKLPPDYATLAHSPLPFVATVRKTLEVWFTHYPQDKKNEFLSRFRSDNVSYCGALLELVTHEILLNYAGRVQLEVGLPSGRKPDFHLKTPEGRKLWVECTVAQRSQALEGPTNSARRLQEAVNSIDTSPFRLSWTLLRHSTQSQPRETTLKKHIEDFVHELAERIAGRSILQGTYLGETHWEDRGWKIRFGAYYLPGRSGNDPTIAMENGGNAGINEENEGWLGVDAQKLRPVLEAKAKQLKSASGSSIIVLSHTESNLDSTGDVLKIALFGNSTSANRHGPFYGSADNPSNQHVTGVLYFPWIKAHMFCSHEAPWFYVPHPWSSSPLGEDIFTFARRGALNSDGSLEWSEPLCTLNDLLCLPFDWPGIPAPPSPS